MRAKIRSTCLGVLLAAWVAVPAVAQEAAPPTPGVATMRYYQCGLADLDEAVGILNGTWREIADEMVSEGALIGYGILTHSWGDEWNLVDYFVSTDLAAFQSAFGQMIVRYQRRDRDGSELERLGEICPVHKDNIYSVVPPR